MKLSTQIAALVLVAAVAGAGWHFRDRLPFLGGQADAPPPGQAQNRGGAQPIPVEAVRVEVRELSNVVEAIGSAMANEAVAITAKATGVVERIGFQEGQKVAAGAIVVELDAGENRAKVEEFRAARENARQNLERAQTLLESRAIPQARVDELKRQFEIAEAKLRAEQAKYGDTVLRAPFSGRLGMRQMSLGALVRPGEVITTLDDISVIKLEFEIPEIYLAEVQPGLKVRARSAAYPDRKFEGRVTIVDTRVDPVTRSAKVRALIENGDEALRPGMFLTVELSVGRKPNAIVVPEEALLAFGGQQFVFVVREGRSYRTRVAIGQRVPGFVEVTEGLAPDAMVVVGGLQKVRDGAPVRIVGPGAPVPSAANPPSRKPAS
ncbi:MAG: efflux RND transporter periplasmic adaptor subunit [Alphaproteobacteria bacterium]|nr:efflux RND transporter periplasmic adaptor subunit [Alphaproteobacteria bacterium]